MGIAAVLSTAAHVAGGGANPGPGGLLILGLALWPLGALLTRSRGGIPALLGASLAAQFGTHLLLSVVTAPSSHGHAATLGSTATIAPHNHYGISVETSHGGWSASAAALTHLAHADGGMLAAHLLGAVVSALVLVAARSGMARILRRLSGLLLVDVTSTTVLRVRIRDVRVFRLAQLRVAGTGPRAPPLS